MHILIILSTLIACIQASCTYDTECPDDSFCYEELNCTKCVDCTRYNRKLAPHGCAKLPEECGDCIPGTMERDIHTDGSRNKYCDYVKINPPVVVSGNSFAEPSTSAPPDIKNAGHSMWIIVVVIIVSIIVTVVLSFVFRRKITDIARVIPKCRYRTQNGQDIESNRAPPAYSTIAPAEKKNLLPITPSAPLESESGEPTPKMYRPPKRIEDEHIKAGVCRYPCYIRRSPYEVNEDEQNDDQPDMAGDNANAQPIGALDISEDSTELSTWEPGNTENGAAIGPTSFENILQSNTNTLISNNNSINNNNSFSNNNPGIENNYSSESDNQNQGTERNTRLMVNLNVQVIAQDTYRTQ